MIRRPLVRAATANVAARVPVRAAASDAVKARAAALAHDLDRFGLPHDVPAEERYNDKYGKHRQVVPLRERGAQARLEAAASAWAAPCATLVGQVELWDNSSVWYGATIKADAALVRIGAYSNVQDKAVVGVATGALDAAHDGSTMVGHYVTIGHKCRLRACTIEDECLVGTGSVLEDGSYMERHSMLGAGSVLAAGARVPSGELWVGAPARFKRHLTATERTAIRASALHYHKLAMEHRDAVFGSGGLGPQTAHWELERRGVEVGAREWPAVEPAKN